MRLAVRHETRFSYEESPSSSVQRLYLTPPNFASQKVLSWKISSPGIDEAVSYLDGFGNRVHLVTIVSPIEPFSIIAEGVAECTDQSGVVRGLVSPAPDDVFLRVTPATRTNAAMADMARSVAAGGAVLDVLHRLMEAIHGRVAFIIGATGAGTTAAEAFDAASGVCQDHTHIFLAMARFLDIPARYVTGYLAMAEGQSSTAAHAWAEARVPGLGWVGFDAANATCPNDHYVRVAAGIDAAGVSPVRGSRRGGHNEQMEVAVLVEIAQQ